MAGHNWSGWPGAWCLDCGRECGMELCVATCPWPSCPKCKDLPEGSPCEHCSSTGLDPKGPDCQDPSHKDGDCPEPGSNRHNPYTRPANEKLG